MFNPFRGFCLAILPIYQPFQSHLTQLTQTIYPMQRKKKPTENQSQKVLVAQYRNEFFRKIKLVIDTFCGKNIYPLIPQRVLDDIYLCRSSPFKYKIAPGSTVPNNIFNDAKAILRALPSNASVTIRI